MTNPDSTPQATLEDIRNHRKKIADNPWPFPAEKMNYVIPMVEMSSILSLVEAQAKELQELKNQKAVCCDCNGTYDLGFNYCTQCAFKDLDVSEKQAKRIEELERDKKSLREAVIVTKSVIEFQNRRFKFNPKELRKPLELMQSVLSSLS